MKSSNYTFASIQSNIQIKQVKDRRNLNKIKKKVAVYTNNGGKMKPYLSYAKNKIYTRKVDSYTKKIRKKN